MKFLLILLLLVSCGKEVTKNVPATATEERIADLEDKLGQSLEALTLLKEELEILKAENEDEVDVLETTIQQMELRIQELEKELCHRGKKKNCHGR